MARLALPISRPWEAALVDRHAVWRALFTADADLTDRQIAERIRTWNRRHPDNPFPAVHRRPGLILTHSVYCWWNRQLPPRDQDARYRPSPTVTGPAGTGAAAAIMERQRRRYAHVQIPGGTPLH